MTTNPLEEARALLTALSEEVDALNEKDTLTPEEDARFSELTAEDGEYKRADARVKAYEARAKRVDEIRAEAAAKPAAVEAGTASGPTLVRTAGDPFAVEEIRGGMSADALGHEYRARAHQAIESAPEYMTDAHRESAAILVDRDKDGDIAKYLLDHGSQDYVDAWFHYMRSGRWPESGDSRAAMTTTAANGGYLIPFYLDPTIILTNAGSVNPFRAISRVVSITTNAWHGVTSAGVSAQWTSEAQEWSDASPTFAQPTITPVSADAYVQASFEVTQDTNIASQIGMLFADAKDNLEAAAFATGTGAGQPEGLITRLNVTTNSKVAANTNATFGAPDLFNLVNNLPPRYSQNPSWLGHWAIFNLVRQFTSGASPQAANFWVDLGPKTPSQLLGAPVYRSSSMTSSLSAATASTDNILILGDFSQFLIVDRIGMETVYNPLVIGTNRRPTGEVGWGCFWRVGSDTTDPGAFRMLQA